jgi:tetratricopeptide (TPR) repeat protein
MRHHIFTGFLVGVFALGAGLAARAQAGGEEPLPEVGILTCGRQCANFVPAKPVLHEFGTYPRRSVSYGGWDEGYVWLLYKVGTDGKTRDISLIQLVGSQRFADLTMEQVKGWTFQPATMDGKPVEESRFLRQNWIGVQEGTRPSMFNPMGPDVRKEVKDAYEGAAALLSQGRADDGRAMLTQAFERRELNFFERGVLALPLLKMALQRKDYLEARRIAIEGTLIPLWRVKPAIGAELWEGRISADLMLGQMADVSDSFSKLKAIQGYDPNLKQWVKGFDSNSPFAKLVQNALDKAAAAPQLVGQGRIPRPEDGGIYWHTLSRRAFTFAGITGSLDSFVLNCIGGAIESRITATAQWHVPKSWGNCLLYVRGAPNTTFSVVETHDQGEQLADVMARHNDAVAADPRNAVVYMARARAYDDAQNFPAAIADFSKAAELNPKLAAAYLARAKVHEETKDFPAAIADYSKAIEINPLAETYYRRALVRDNAGQLAAALADADKAVTLDPKEYYMRFYRGYLRRAVGQYRESVADYDEYLKQDAQYLKEHANSEDLPAVMKSRKGQALRSRAVTLFLMGNFERAEADLEESVNLLGPELYTYNWLHILRTRRKASDDPLYFKIRAADSSPVAQIADLYRGTKTLADVEALMAAANRDPEEKKHWPCTTRFFLGEYRLAQGDTAGARADFASVNRPGCEYAETDVAAAELKRLAAQP